ncbi:MAG: DUF4065 domain-containing protein [Clostridia bacterium]|nr:DUF4065 domain-containing protein [Clostridia bacterium]
MKVYCPYCREEKEYIIETREVKEFRGKEIDTYENVAMCKTCKNDLYVNELETENSKRIYEAYRQTENIIKPQDIIDLRSKYDISQRELTAILGFGKMTINRYERGGVPTKSQSDYIKLLIENESKFIEKVKEAYSKNNITKKTYEKIMSKENYEECNTNNLQNLIRKCITNNLSRTPDIYNGYKLLDLDKLENIISYIASQVKNLTVTSINKYLWYIDMLSFKEQCVAVTGLTYEHEKFGPTIDGKNYNTLMILNNKYVKEETENDYGTTTQIVSKKNYDLNCLSDDELEIINKVIKLLKNKKVTDISAMSHLEDGWKKTKRYEKISFEYAMNLSID